MGSALPASRFGGVPVFPSAPQSRDRRPRTCLSQPRAPRGRSSEERRRSARTDSTLPGFHPLQRMKGRGLGLHGRCLARHRPSSAFRTLSTACTPRPRPEVTPATWRPEASRRARARPRERASRDPGNAPGVPPSGPCSSPGGRASLEAACSLAVRSSCERREAQGPRPRSSEPSSPRRVRAARGRKPTRGRCPPDVSPPLRRSLPPR